MDDIFAFLPGFFAGLLVYWLLWGPKKKKVNGLEYAVWEYGSPFVRCSNCGCRMNDESNYCPDCGYRMLKTKRVYQEPEDIGTTWEQLKQSGQKD